MVILAEKKAHALFHFDPSYKAGALVMLALGC